MAWRENGAGPWQIDQAVYGPSGRLIQTPQPLPQSGGITNLSAGAPALIVDDFNRPLFMWSATGTGNATPTATEYTGGFVSAAVELSMIRTGFANTSAPDFANYGQPGLTTFRTQVTNSMGWVQYNISHQLLCAAQLAALDSLYTLVTTFQPPPVQWGPDKGVCSLTIPSHHSLFGNNTNYTTGPLDPNVYLWAETETLLEALGVGIMLPPTYIASLVQATPPNSGGTGLFQPGLGATGRDWLGNTVSIQPLTISPDQVLLNTTGSFISNSEQTPIVQNGISCGSTTITDTPSHYWTNVTVWDAYNSTKTLETYSSWSAPPSVYVKNVKQNLYGNWSATETATFNVTVHVANTCTNANTTAPFTGTLPGSWVRQDIGRPPCGLLRNRFESMAVEPRAQLQNHRDQGDKQPFLVEHTRGRGRPLAQLHLEYEPGCKLEQPELRYSGKCEPSPVPTGLNYTVTLLLQSGSGLWNNSWKPAVNLNNYNTSGS